MIALTRSGNTADFPNGYFLVFGMEFTPIPEPGTAALLGLGLMTLGARRR